VPDQLTLSVSLSNFASFENYYPTGNEELVAALHHFVAAADKGSKVIHLFGNTGCGKTHLMCATMRLARETNHSASYVPLQSKNISTSVLKQIKGHELVCVDDIDVIAGEHIAERALFQLYERIQIGNGKLVTSARGAANHLGLGLRDLVSRLQGGASYRVVSLRDEQKRDALRFRAASRGFALSDEVTEYVLRRYPRDTHTLFGLLECIDEASLSAKRRVTIPFLKDLENRLGL